MSSTTNRCLAESPTDEGFTDGFEGPEIEIPAWITALTEEQRADFAFQLLLTLPTPKLAQLHTRLSPLFHRDFLTLLPLELALHILSFLDAQTLGRVARVSKEWRKISSDGFLWRKLYFRNGWTVNKRMIEWYTSSHQPPAQILTNMNAETSKKRSNVDVTYSMEQMETDDDCEMEDIQDHCEGDKLESHSHCLVASEESISTSRALMLSTTPLPQTSNTAIPVANSNTNISSNEELDPLNQSVTVSVHQETSPIIPTFLHPPATRSTDNGFLMNKNITAKLPPTPIPAHFPFPPSAYIRYHLPMHQNEAGQPVINWKYLYHQRTLIENNWRKGDHIIRELPGHKEGIYCIQFDEHKIISGSRDDTIKIWDIKSGYCMRTYKGHMASVLCLQYDEKIIVSGSSDTTIIIWDLATGEKLRTLRGHSESVLNLRFDDVYIVSCSKDRTVRIWDRETGESIRVLRDHRAAVNAVQFLNGYVVSASGDRTIKLWSLDTGQCLRTFDGHSRGIACIQFDGNIIVSGSSDKTIKIFDVHTGTCLRTLAGHTDLVRTLQFDGNRIVSGSYDETLRVWDLKTGEMLKNLVDGHTSRIFKLQFNDTQIVSCSQDQKIIIWDFAHNVDKTFLV